jgi:uncharacterized membrane protein
MAQELKIGDCLSDGWSGFKKNAGVSIGILLIFALISGCGGSIPVVNVAYNLVVAPIISAGLSIFALNVTRGGEGKIDDLFRGFNRFGEFLGAYWLYVLIVIIAFIPAGIGFGIDVLIHGGITGLFPYVTIVLGVVSLVALVIALLRWSMVYYLIIDGKGVMDAFRESARITKGYRGTIFLLVLVMGLIMLGGLLCLFVGMLVAAPVTMIAFSAAYNRLNPGGQPAIVRPAAPAAPPAPPAG